MVKFALRGHVVAKMHAGYLKPEGSETAPLTAADFEESTSKSRNLFADSTVPSFFR
jgi:hypothetical protein